MRKYYRSVLRILVLFIVVNREIRAQNQTDGSESRLSEKLEIFNEIELLNRWDDEVGKINVSEQCEREMKIFLLGVRNEKGWAVRMTDASGKYNSGLYWGNDLWVGSAALCKKLDEANVYNHTVYERVDPINAEFVITYEKRQLYRTDPNAKYAVPPFRLMFTTVLMKINATSQENKAVHVVTKSFCLPKSCDTNDIGNLIKFTSSINKSGLSRDVTILKVRQLNGVYNVWEDTFFYLITISSILIMIFMIIGTAIDLYLKKTNKIVPALPHSSDNNNINPPKSKLTNGLPQTSLPPQCEDGKLSISYNHPGIVSRIFLSFSVPANIKRICAPDIGEDTLRPIHGLRLLSFIWVVLVHTCLIYFQMADNKNFRNEAEADVLYQTVSNASFSVDTFFYISGVLVAFLFFRTMSRYTTKQLVRADGFLAQCAVYISLIGYRFIRLSPPYLAVIAISSISTKYLKANSIIDLPGVDHINCEKYWWRNILYINTFFSNQEMCMVWSWYLANDTQFYLIGVILLLLAVKHIRVAGGIIAVLLLTAWGTTAAITVVTGYIPTIADPFAHYDELYNKPWTRLGPYFIGMVSGYVLNAINCQMRVKRVVAYLGWIFSATVILTLLYGLYYFTFNVYTAAIYVSLSHTIWSLAIAWILFACVSGYGGFVNNILCWKYINPFSRLTYCAYLIHPVIIKLVLQSTESPIHITRVIVAIQFFGFLVASFAIALVISLMFEAPVVSLLHLAHPIRKKRLQANRS